MTDAAAPLKRTPLYPVHRALGAKMVDFGGWEMPVQYSGIVDEHNTVRKAVGLFDVSHMGEIEVRGPEALRLVDHVTTNAAARLNAARRNIRVCSTSTAALSTTSWCTKSPDDSFFICVNASNQDKDFAHIRAANCKRLRLRSGIQPANEYAQLAIQGPKAAEVAQKLTAVPLAQIRYYWFSDGDLCRRACADRPHRLYGRRRL